MTDLRSTDRFSDRVADYVRYRPDYPQALVGWLHGLGVQADWTVVDIGAGTGISSKLFLDAGHRVTAIEPNAPMRDAATQWLGTQDGFVARDGTAEATGLPDASVDLVIAGQAFHWFDPVPVRREFARILSPKGLAAIFWNTRRLAGTPFLEGYERLLQEHGTDYRQVSAIHVADDEVMARWFGHGYRGMASFPHSQRLDYEGLAGRALSSSYIPQAGHPGHAPFLDALRALFDATHTGGTVAFDYDTRIFAGHPDA